MIWITLGVTTRYTHAPTGASTQGARAYGNGMQGVVEAHARAPYAITWLREGGKGLHMGGSIYLTRRQAATGWREGGGAGAQLVRGQLWLNWARRGAAHGP